MRHVPHLYIEGDWNAPTVNTTEEQNRHLGKVLRLNKGKPVSYTDGRGRLGTGEWTGTGIVRGEESTWAAPQPLTLAVAVPSSRDRARFVVEKLAELGVPTLVWLDTRWGSGRVPPASKLKAWAVSALEQSRGAFLMETSDTVAQWSDLLEPIAVCSSAGARPEPSNKPRTVVVGPEGGLSSEEIPAGASQVKLGETILRIETAAIAAAIIFRDQ
ncbi:MAG: RsmE family RNA methyltransferase [Acidimicrobiia bacterium]|nr:RsmE family RNA methyltransferase [Acidimicrobiia bacterium]MDH3464275.1 RsmE family RNA methyltransferase [Acidimicrobiia bacterium]